MPKSPNSNSNKELLHSPDKEFENNIRPGYIKEFSGQQQIIDNITIFIKASKLRGEALDHILFHGPPGLVPMKWGLTSKKHQGLLLKNPAILQGCSPIWSLMMFCL
jgi:Holliday junction DNA helicase RuvB